MPDITRYAFVGTGGRYAMYLRAINRDFNNLASTVGLCDINPHRVELARRYQVKLGGADVPVFGANDFSTMIETTHPDVVIVTSIDRTHHRYIIKAMEMGCDVITEKPMTTDADKCQAIVDAVKRTGQRLRVTFNYRYAPRNSQVKALLQQKVVGNIKSVHFEWLLDTRHGADYFRRWHRDKRNSGGLLVHKATHHFDLMNWWLDSYPREVYAQGDLMFYGRENAEERGVSAFYERSTGNPIAASDPFALDLAQDKLLRQIYLDAEPHDGYRRDQSVFGDGISIEDDLSVMVRYENRAVMTYHLTAYSPWEGYRIAFNGDAGRLEYEVHESSYVSGSEADANSVLTEGHEVHEPARIVVRPHWSRPYEVDLDSLSEAGHGGGDARLLQDLFAPAADDALGRAADHVDGARSVLTGIAANRSMATGAPVRVADLVSF